MPLKPHGVLDELLGKLFGGLPFGGLVLPDDMPPEMAAALVERGMLQLLGDVTKAFTHRSSDELREMADQGLTLEVADRESAVRILLGYRISHCQAFHSQAYRPGWDVEVVDSEGQQTCFSLELDDRGELLEKVAEAGRDWRRERRRHARRWHEVEAWSRLGWLDNDERQ